MPAPKPKPSIFIFCALPCEAKPLIEFYKLKKDTSISCFDIYSNDEICLTVTGIGKIAMAAGVAYTQALFAERAHPVMVNIGIAGHQSEAVGNLFLIDKITDCDSRRRFYPPLVFTPPCPTASLHTHARPQSEYHEASLCDMEGSAFYETAIRFSTGELCQCLKIVSDNALSPAQHIQANQVSADIQAKRETINQIIETLTGLAASLHQPEDNALFDALTHRYRFSVNEQMQLKKLLSRWSVINGENTLDVASLDAKNGKEFLSLLTQKLNLIPFNL